MAKYELKTKLNDESVSKFLDMIADEQKRSDAYEIVDMMRSVTKKEPKMWGSSIVGFDSYHYVYESGHEGDSCMVGFSPRKQNLTLYVMGGGIEDFQERAKKLGKCKTGKGCLYVNKLDDIDRKALKDIVKAGYAYVKKTYKTK